jgi:hypothetical protein
MPGGEICDVQAVELAVRVRFGQTMYVVVITVNDYVEARDCE